MKYSFLSTSLTVVMWVFQKGVLGLLPSSADGQLGPGDFWSFHHDRSILYFEWRNIHWVTVGCYGRCWEYRQNLLPLGVGVYNLQEHNMSPKLSPWLFSLKSAPPSVFLTSIKTPHPPRCSSLKYESHAYSSPALSPTSNISPSPVHSTSFIESVYFYHRCHHPNPSLDHCNSLQTLLPILLFILSSLLFIQQLEWLLKI